MVGFVRLTRFPTLNSVHGVVYRADRRQVALDLLPLSSLNAMTVLGSGHLDETRSEVLARPPEPASPPESWPRSSDGERWPECVHRTPRRAASPPSSPQHARRASYEAQSVRAQTGGSAGSPWREATWPC